MGELGPQLTQRSLGRGLRTKWHLDTSGCLATIDVGRKVGVVFGPF